MTVNKAILIGKLGKDPEIRSLPNGDAVSSVTLATSNKYKNRNGEMVDETEWHNVTFFGRLAEIVGQYLKKGSSIYVEGRIKTEKYTDKNGVEKYATKIIAGELKMLGGRTAGENESHEANGAVRQKNAQQVSRNTAPPRQNPQQGDGSGFDDMDDDIPF